MKLIEYFRQITNESRWNEVSEQLLNGKLMTPHFISDFHLYWIEHGHSIREQINNDNKVLDLLTSILPPYEGSDVLLYRGENIDRLNGDNVGFCWTPRFQTAKMFARGLNSVGSGGILLECLCKADWIIAGPHPHSQYLGEHEYTVNPKELDGIRRVEEFAPLT